MSALIVFVLPNFVVMCLLLVLGSIANGLTDWWFGGD